MVCGYAFWIPLRADEKLAILSASLESCALQDIPDSPYVTIRANIDVVTFNITISYKLSVEDCSHHIVLQNTFRDDSGILIYQTVMPDAPCDYFAESFKHGLHKSVYHYIKGFFHVHRYHDDDMDSILPVLSQQNAIRWDDRVMESLMHDIIHSYIKRFGSYSEDCIVVVSQKLDELRHNKHITKNIHDLGEEIRRLVDLLYETDYSQNLVSLYPNYIEETDRQQLERIVTQLRNLQERVSFQYDIIVQTISVDLGSSGKNWGVLGAFIGVVALIFSIVVSMPGPSRMSYEDRQFIDSVVDKKTMEIKVSLDSLPNVKKEFTKPKAMRR